MVSTNDSSHLSQSRRPVKRPDCGWRQWLPLGISIVEGGTTSAEASIDMVDLTRRSQEISSFTQIPMGISNNPHERSSPLRLDNSCVVFVIPQLPIRTVSYCGGRTFEVIVEIVREESLRPRGDDFLTSTFDHVLLVITYGIF